MLVAERGMTTLGEFRRARHFKAKPGGRGGGARSHGRNAENVELRVAPGTVVRTVEGDWVGELVEPGDRLMVARGGSGGRGNARFATATHQAPRHAEKGEPGEERWIELELKLIADIGLVGAPNAGKSTLLAALTAATPRVDSYPFTTLSPNLGVVEFDDGERATVADVPGLIEGAHEGAGLGHEFLRHVERTRALVAVVRGDAADPAAEWRAVWDELRKHDRSLVERPVVSVVTKMDLRETAERWPAVRKQLTGAGLEPIAISAHDGRGLDELRAALHRALRAASELEHARAEPPVRIHRFETPDDAFDVVAEGDGLRVRGRAIERAASRTDFENEESRERFQRRLERAGIDAELRRRGARSGTTVRIGPSELEWYEE